MTDATTRVFEETIAPALLGPAPAWPRPGTILFVVGPRSFTVRLGNKSAPVVEPGVHEAPDLVLSVAERALQDLVDGTLDLDAAIASSWVGYRGDLGLLETLGRLLAGAQRAHTLRGMP